jgi:uncharacterized protein (DUF1778 family)
MSPSLWGLLAGGKPILFDMSFTLHPVLKGGSRQMGDWIATPSAHRVDSVTALEYKWSTDQSPNQLGRRGNENIAMTTSSAHIAAPDAPATETHHKRARLQARLSLEQQHLLERAAALEGQTLTEFVLVHAQEAARRTIREHQTMALSERDSRAFVEALLSPWQPSPELQENARRMREAFDPPPLWKP